MFWVVITHTPLNIWVSWVPSPSAPKSPPSAWKTHPPLFLLHLRGQLTPFSFQLASPPRIHMDSWWATRNLNQGPKWAHNIAQNRSGAYGPEPCRIWVPKLPKSVFYTGWLDEPAEPTEPDANRSNRLQKILKIWQNVPGRVRNPWKKMVCNSKFEWGSHDQNNYQKSVFYTGWLDEPAEPTANQPTGWKNFWKFDRMFLEEWGIHKKNGTQFRVRKREIWSK